jgi:hypothetical protein
MPELELCKVGSNLLHKLGPRIFLLFLNIVNFRHINEIYETFHMAGTKLGIFSFNFRY